MYVKVNRDKGAFPRDLLLETKTLSWKFLETTEEAEAIQSDAQVGDYGMYEDVEDLTLVLTLDDDLTVMLDSGVVYIMNEEGKTIDTISV